MSAPYGALTIARWFVAWANAEDADLSNLKLQKILYYAQGWHLAQRGEPLFSEEIEAWSHGPVVPDVYHAFKKYGSDDLRRADDDSFAWDDVDSRTTKFLMKVWNTYGQFAAWRLRNLTHAEAPWKKHFQEDERHIVIPVEDMRDFFAKRAITHSLG